MVRKLEWKVKLIPLGIRMAMTLVAGKPLIGTKVAMEKEWLSGIRTPEHGGQAPIKKRMMGFL